MKSPNGDEEGLSREVVELRQRIAKYETRESDLKVRTRRIAGLSSVREDLLRPGSLQERLKRITDGLVALFDADFARIWVTKPGDRCDAGCVHANVTDGPHVCRYRDRCLHLLASSGRYTHIDGEMHGRVPFGCYKIGRVASGLESKFLTNDVTHDIRIHDRDWARNLGLVSFAGFRLMSEEGTPIGVMAIFSKHALSDDDSLLLEGMATSAAHTLQTSTIEEALRQNEEMLKSILSTSPVGIVLTQDRRIKWTNEAWVKMFGFAKQEYLDQDASIVYPSSAEYKRVGKELYPNLSLGYVTQTDALFRRQDGSVFEGHIRMKALYPADLAKGTIAAITDISERKQAEEELNERERFLSSIFSSIQDGISVLDKDLTIIRVNPTMERWYSHAMPLTGKRCYEAYHSISSPCQVCPTLQTLHTGQMAHEVVPRRGPGGSITGWLDLYSFPLLDATTGEIRGIIEYVRDISERKRSEERLQFEKERFEMLAENAPFGMLMVSEKGYFEYVNPGFKEIFGYDLNDVPNGREWFRRAYPDPAYRKEVIAAWIDDLQGRGRGETRPRVFTVTCKDGSEKIISFRPVRLGAGQDLVTCEDITEGKEAERQLLESELRYRTLFEESRDAVITTTRDGKVEAVNQAYLDLFGFTREEAENMDILNIYVDPADRVRFQEDIERHGSLKDYEVRRRKKDGTVIDCLLTSTVRLDEDGRIVGYQGIVRDVTEQKQLQRQLLQAQKMEAIGQLAGGVAHDFNNILTAIIGYSDVLTQQMPEDSPYRSKLIQINRAGARAAHLTRQLLAFSRKQILDLRPLNLNEVLANFEKMLRTLIGENIEVVTLLDLSAGTVMGDATQIEQILLNLAINARDAMLTGGKLTLETANVSLDRAYARTHSEVRPGPYVMLAVSDTGQGIDSHVLPRIFDPFFTTKGKDKGTGLGLSTVYGIVKQHQGHITAYSEPGRGTTFKVYLPLVQNASEQVPSVPATAPRLGGKETVIVVEDEEIVRQLTTEVLETLGYSVLQCRDAEEAIRVTAIHGGPIHLLLTDVVLPQMDGRSLFGFLSPMFPDMRVLYVSGYAENAIVHHGVLDAGVKFLQKPFTVDSLAKKVREVLDEP